MRHREDLPALPRRVLLGVALLIAAAATAQQPPATVTFTVDAIADQIDANLDDGICRSVDNTCSLRAAIMQANHRVAPGVTRVNVPAGTYVLTRLPNGANGEDNGDLNLTTSLGPNQSILISGEGAGRTIIDGNQIDGVFRIDQGRRAEFAGVTIRNGYRRAGYGGGIANSGTLSIAGSVIENNYAEYSGGGIDSSNGAVNFAGSTLRANVSDDRGGGIFFNGTTLTITDSVIEGNRAQYDGGGVDCSADTLNIVRSGIRTNNSGDRGGGIFLSGGGLSTLRDSAVYRNGADSGGGIFNTSNDLQVVNGTVSGNYATNNGGGIANVYDPVFDIRIATTFLFSTTVAGNDADHDHDELGGNGGGVYASPGSRFAVLNSLIAGNTQRDIPLDDDCFGTLEANFRTLFGDLTGCSLSGSWGLVSRDTIGPLRDNGGPTLTHALLAGSEAIDGVVSAGACIDPSAAPMTTDQRGAPRPAGSSCDIGAFEYGAIVDQIFRNGFN